ncbi:GGDEF domain-containing protein [Halobacillus litoralis]|uniref:GGDEF domain-containing protein n=1 Tax=Halobacillus litoralis TaxID=45668 RepID=UPI001CFDFD5C|nr:GGDEF domain-containing protein [Halobacillus litoralis]
MKNHYLLWMLAVYVGLGIVIGLCFSTVLSQFIVIPKELVTLFLFASIIAGLLLGVVNHLVFYLFTKKFTHHFSSVLQSVRNGDLSARSTLNVGGVVGELNTNINKTVAALEETQNCILHDDLTDLPNRQALQQFFLDKQNQGKDYALLFLDVNEFKQINDTYGHVIGDEVLRFIALVLTKSVGLEDKVYRLSGDEFVIVHSTEQYKTEKLCSLIHQQFRDSFLIEGHTIKITVSIGICEFCFGEKDFVAILDQADQAMYKVKRAGGHDIRQRTL